MANPNQPTSTSDLVNQLAQLLQQLQIALTSKQAESHQRPWKEPLNTMRSPKKEYIRKLFLKSDVKRLDKRCNALFTALTSEQHGEFLEIINKKFPEALNDKQIPEALEFSIKVLENMIENKRELSPKEKPIVAEVLEPYSTTPRDEMTGHIKRKAKKEKPKNGEQKSSRERINDSNDQKKNNKKDISENRKIIDDPENPLGDI
ncbi:hypothetical protein C2G38_2151097 [Gigaspora rosea]|uniref:Uncharacterized protein n=1 Tax=Gigaspora rosea TaxID=44941 RepID=A0A397WEB3_9GLOM|nr:hypothetical protein C2G38_2151097 [Gigaspora rosea]